MPVSIRDFFSRRICGLRRYTSIFAITEKYCSPTFEPDRRDDVIDEIQRRVDAYWAEVE